MKELDVGQERELEALIVRNAGCIESGLKVLTHQPRANGKFIDVLSVDSDGVLVVIELKINEADEVLCQVLEYYDYVSSNRDRLASEYASKAKINIEENPRIILVAPSFSDRLRKALRYFSVEIELKQYAYLETAGGERELYCREITLAQEEGYTPTVSREAVLAYIDQPALRDLCRKVHEDILALGRDLEEAPKSAGTEIRYKCKNRQVGGLTARRKVFYVWWRLDPDNCDEIEVSKAGDWSAKKTQVLAKLRKRYKELGGE